MTPEQNRQIAELAVLAFDARRDLQDIESRSADRQGARTARRKLADAETALDKAIRSSVQR